MTKEQRECDFHRGTVELKMPDGTPVTAEVILVDNDDDRVPKTFRETELSLCGFLSFRTESLHLPKRPVPWAIAQAARGEGQLLLEPDWRESVLPPPDQFDFGSFCKQAIFTVLGEYVNQVHRFARSSHSKRNFDFIGLAGHAISMSILTYLRHRGDLSREEAIAIVERSRDSLRSTSQLRGEQECERGALMLDDLLRLWKAN